MMRSEGGLGSYLPEICLLIVLGVLLSWNVHLMDLEPTAEFFHLAAAKENVLQHHFWLPHIQGHPYLLRGPLWTWICTLLFQIGGVSLSIARIPAILCALVGIALTGLITRTLTGSRVSSWCTSAILGTCWGFQHLAIQSGPDIAAMDLNLLFIWIVLEWNAMAERRNTQVQEVDAYSVAMGVTLALLFLVKDAFSVFLIAAIALVYVVLNNNVTLLKKLNPLYILAPIAVLPLPWLLIGTLGGHHASFIGESWFIYPWQRFLGLGPWEGLHADWLFYLRAIPLDLLPYLLFLPMPLIDRFIKSKEGYQYTHVSPQQSVARRAGTTVGGHWHTWAVVWFLTGFVLYSVSAFQEPGLLLPFYPPLALLLGTYLGQIVEAGDSSPTRSYQNTVTFMILVLMLCAVMLTIFIFQVLPDNYVVGQWRFFGDPMLSIVSLGSKQFTLPEPVPLWKMWLIPGSIILLIGGLSLFVLQLRQRYAMTVPVTIGVFLSFFFFVKGIDLPIMQHAIPQQIAADLSRRADVGDTITLYTTRPALKRVWFFLKAKPYVTVKFKPKAPFKDPLLAEASLNTVTLKPAEEAKPRRRRRHRRHDPEVQTTVPVVVEPLAPQPATHQYGVVGEKTYFQQFSSDFRDATRVLSYGWTWEHAQGSEILKFLMIRAPQFNKMKSGLLAFEDLVPQPFTLAPDPALQAVESEH